MHEGPATHGTVRLEICLQSVPIVGLDSGVTHSIMQFADAFGRHSAACLRACDHTAATSDGRTVTPARSWMSPGRELEDAFQEPAVSDKVLFVDDEPAILDGLRRALHDRFLVSSAIGGEQGLVKLRTDGPFAVVVSDMQMPGMNGAEFLERASGMVPDTVRILLTGHADVNAAIDAVNRGNIFRFLTKPCEKHVLLEAIRKGSALYHATVDERKKLKKAEMIERLQSGWDSRDIYQTERFKGAGALPGPAEARIQMQALFQSGSRGYALLMKMTMLRTIEERYGEKAADEFLQSTTQFLRQVLKPEDRLFHWSKDVLMALLERQLGPAALRLEMSRITQDRQDWITGLNGSKVMIANSIGFDLLPLSMFPSIDEMLAAFDARLIGKL